MTCRGPDRVYAQYRDKPKTVAWLDIANTIGDQLCQAFEDITTSYDPYTATGESLNIIGRVVVIDRSILESIPLETYEFNGDGDYEFNDDGDFQFSATSILADAELSDEYFRTLVLSKIVKNNSDATLDGIVESVLTIIPNANYVTVTDGEDMTFSIEINGTLTSIQRELIATKDIVPKPQGVKFNGFVETLGVAQFNGDGEYEFGDTDSEFVGFTGV